MIYDFTGWATKNDLLCKDGRVIKKDAFKVQNGTKVPLVWNHQHNDVGDVLGHGILENRPEGVLVYGKFNNTEKGRHAKESVQHGDVTALSIWANDLKQEGNEVYHGTIREVSLVLAGANPGAFIESVVSHGMPMEDFDEEGILYTDTELYISHSIDNVTTPENKKKGDSEMTNENIVKHSDDETVQDVINTMDEKQKKVMYAMIAAAMDDDDDEDDEEDEPEMKHNVFSDNQQDQDYLSHADMENVFKEAKRLGSLREAVNTVFDGGIIAHALPTTIPTTGMTTPSGPSASATYGIKGMNMFLPDYQIVGGYPQLISRDMDWVTKVLSMVHNVPFSRIKSLYANITEEEARARGYLKGKQKKEEVFTTLKRTTDPQTIYKKQKIDRDDMIDITDFDVVAWIKSEMKLMLNEELARAILIGDGRQSDSDDKIKEVHIRPILSDVDLFNVKCVYECPQPGATLDEYNKHIGHQGALIDEILRARANYKGSGNPVFFANERYITEMLLIKDDYGHRLYKTEQELATALRVSQIVPVEPMVTMKHQIESVDHNVVGVIVNLEDYALGANKGGEENLFEDFDIDYNQQKYLIETRRSGALVKPFSAISVFVKVKS